MLLWQYCTSEAIMQTKEPLSLPELYERVEQLRQTVYEEGTRLFKKWHPRLHRKEAQSSIQNFAYYLALRHYDIRNIQIQLAHYGLADLSQLELYVLPQLDMVRYHLATLCHKAIPSTGFDKLYQIDINRHSLHDNTRKIFGKEPKSRYTRIMVTLPPEAVQPQVVAVLLEKGMDIARINCSHDTPADWQEMADNVHFLSNKLQKNCKIYFDIAGPKIRIESVYTILQNPRLIPGSTFFLTAEETMTSYYNQSIVLSCAYPEVIDTLKLNDRLSIDDGHITAHVIAKKNEGAIFLVDSAAKDGGFKIKATKGLNFPDNKQALPLITKRDKMSLKIARQYADIIGFSFIQTVDDVTAIQHQLDTLYGSIAMDIPIILKIETVSAFNSLPDILAIAVGHNPVGVMIARGDLAVEAGYLRLTELQEEILWLCEAAHVPVIWATQILESLIKNGVPTRAEMTDATAACRAEVAMLNKGPYLESGIALLDKVLESGRENQNKKNATLRSLHVAKRLWQ